jgi:hypothetical protein
MPESQYERMVRHRFCSDCKHGTEHNIDTIGYTSCHPIIGDCLAGSKWEPYIDDRICCHNCKHGQFHNGVQCIKVVGCLGGSRSYNYFERWYPVETSEGFDIDRYMPQPTVMPDEPMRFKIEEEE